MPNTLQVGSNILFMKVGVHAQESLEQIIARKQKEIDDAGYALWGYGGNTCHPTTKIRPFVQKALKSGPIYLCMQKIDSKHHADPVRAELYSADGVDYHPIHPAINVLGSRFALAIKNLHEDDFDLPLQHTRVAVGECTGRIGSEYIRGLVDKACLEISPDYQIPLEIDAKVKKISLVAELCEPYAVYLKNK